MTLRGKLERHFAERLKTLRAERRLTQRKLADLVGASASNVCYWETGRGLPHIWVLYRLAAALGVELDDLLPSVGEMEQ